MSPQTGEFAADGFGVPKVACSEGLTQCIVLASASRADALRALRRGRISVATLAIDALPTWS